jgi:hypothetical protein
MNPDAQFRVSSTLDLYMGDYPLSIVPEDDNNVFGASGLFKGPRLIDWTKFMQRMSSGFEEGQISFGGKALSSRLDIDSSG